jgi:hypothetical protein
VSAPSDTIYDVRWEGPFDWEQHGSVLRDQHVLYAIYGTHPVYGPGSLLYIGRTERVGGKRLNEHDWWVKDESDKVCFYLGSIGEFKSWAHWDSIKEYGPQDAKLVEAIETLLIHAHQPAYNSRGLQEPPSFHNIRVFNSGKYATLLSECSYRYYRDP